MTTATASADSQRASVHPPLTDSWMAHSGDTAIFRVLGPSPVPVFGTPTTAMC